MGQGPSKGASRGLRTAFTSGSVAGLTDAQLLDRFLQGRDDGASFEALLTRHGPMVLGVCRALLRDEHAADDAFQATFLVLVRRAGSVRVGDSLGRWLYGVAHKVALQSRRQMAIRNHRERTINAASGEPAANRSSDTAESADLRAAIHEELARLPESTRAAIVLCHLEGLTHEEAAMRLGWPVGTVRSRLARGRDRLRARLTRRGLAPSVPILGLNVSPMVPGRLVAATGRAAAKLIAGKAVGIVPASVLTLTSGVLQTMFLTKLKIAALVIGSTSAISLSGAIAYQAGEKGKGDSAAVAQPAEPPIARRLETLQRDIEEPKAAKPDAAKASAPTTRNFAIESPKRPDGPIDPSADELAIQFRLALRKTERYERLYQSRAIPEEIWREQATQPQILGARIEGRMQELRDELERLEAQLRIKQAAVTRAKALVDVAKTVVARNSRINDRFKGAVSEEDKAKADKADSELVVTETEVLIRAAEVQETEVLIKQAKRRLEQFASVAKMAKDALRQDAPLPKPQRPAPPEAR